MKLRITISLIILLAANSVFADYSYVDSSDYTGDSFFSSPMVPVEEKETSKYKYADRNSGDSCSELSGNTTPPIKKLRLIIGNKISERASKNKQLAPTNPDDSIYKSDKNASDFISKDEQEHFDDNMMPDGFEADEEAVAEHRKFGLFGSNKQKNTPNNDKDTENIILDCENMDYDTNNYCLYATGNVKVLFVEQDTQVLADKITYDRANNTIKAEGNVRILKNNQTINGEYIFVDLNEENALIEKPITQTASVEIRASKGYVYGDKIVQENGSLVVDKSYPIRTRPALNKPNLSRMIVPKSQTLTNDMENGVVRLKAQNIKIKEKGDLEVLAIKHATLYKGKYKIFKLPGLHVYTNKMHDYAETNCWELGSRRGLGMYIGPGFVFELPKGSVLKAIPILNYDHRIGVGAIGRFQSGTNWTQAGYGTAGSKILINGHQRLDDNLFLQYGMNDYMNEWFLGKRRPKYGVDLVYDKNYSSYNFLLKDRLSTFRHRAEVGYYQDMDYDKHYGKLHGNNIGTMRVRYMAEAGQSLYTYENIEKQTALDFKVLSQMSASVYGTGDTQVMGRIGPRLHTQYRRWMQDIGYYQSVYSDNTPMPVFDAYRYGKSNVYLREYFRICRYLTVSWFGSINLSGDNYNNKNFQENAFYISVGPDDIKFSIGYDFIRENTFFGVEMMMDAKGAKVDYERMEIKQDKKAKKKDEIAEQPKNNFENSKKAPVLEYAVIEDITPVEDVL